MSKSFTFYFSVIYQKNLKIFTLNTNNALKETDGLLNLSLNSSLKSPKKATVEQILRYAE